jgi:hypothetical protein
MYPSHRLAGTADVSTPRITSVSGKQSGTGTHRIITSLRNPARVLLPSPKNTSMPMYRCIPHFKAPPRMRLPLLSVLATLIES